MSHANNKSKQIVKNTIYLYLRSIIIMAVSIYTSRVVLQALGVDDYGLYNVVGGFVGMFSVLSSSLVNASQRFISYEMGKPDSQMNRVFCATVTVHFFLAICILFVFESLGLWILNHCLNIDPLRLKAANWVFQCSIITFCINLISLPYNATIIAHEKMNVFAYISIYEVFAKLVVAYLLSVSEVDKLILYALLTVLIQISVRSIYGWYCSKHFDECSYRFVADKPIFRSLLSFSGWNFLGSTATIMVTQGINLLINLFFGVALNAARGVAEQVNNAINQFVTNFMTAVNPQITKSYASGDYCYMNNLIIRGSKYATILYWFFSLPLFVEADYILTIWLVDVPPYAPVFLRLVIIYSIFQSLSYTLYVGMLSTGKIKKYQIYMSLLYLSSFVFCYIMFKEGYGPEWGYISAIIAVFLGFFLRLHLLKQIVPHFLINKYIYGAVYKSLFVLLPSTATVWILSKCIKYSSLLEFILVVMVSIFMIPLMTYCFSLDSSEKSFIKAYMKKFVKKEI